MRGHDGDVVVVLVSVLRAAISTAVLSDKDLLEVGFQIAVFNTSKALRAPAIISLLGEAGFCSRWPDNAQRCLLRTIGFRLAYSSQ